MEQQMTLADRIKASPLTRTKIASAAGVSRTTLWHWEVEGRPIEKVDQVIALARVLGCTPADIRPDLAKLFNGAA